MAAIALQLRPQQIFLRNRSFVHLFTSSSDNNGGDEKESRQPPPSPPSQPSSPMSSLFNDVKASLRQSPPSPQAHSRRLFESPPRDTPSHSPSPPQRKLDLVEIRNNLAAFRRSTSPSPSEKPPSVSPTAKAFSFHELYKKNVTDKGDGGSDNSGENSRDRLPFSSIRASLQNLRISGEQNQNDRFRPGVRPERMGTLNIKPSEISGGKRSAVVNSGFETSSTSIFNKELFIKSESSEASGSENDLIKPYSYDELGQKLQKLRPVEKNAEGNNWFSLKELNERLTKLRLIEQEELNSRKEGTMFRELRESMVKLQLANQDNNKRPSMQRLDCLGQLGGTPSFMGETPKEQLVEKFFHPDNMSSAEKLKLELKKVREEFKISESDCGSSRVQVAQLTTKIKHLSSVLHKKDKHSRKGLQEMVQRRKKLLRYLRRTDWDSYCFCLSKLGLRDNPDYKN